MRVREMTHAGPVIHAEDCSGDGRTLCGYAQEGSAIAGEGDEGWEPVSRGKISCGTCLRIIRYCKSLPASLLQGGVRR